MVNPDNVAAAASLGLAPALSAYWIEQVLARLETGPVPRLWPGTKAEARELAAIYFEQTDDVEWLASRVQRIALAAWPRFTQPTATARGRDFADEACVINVEVYLSEL